MTLSYNVIKVLKKYIPQPPNNNNVNNNNNCDHYLT